MLSDSDTYATLPVDDEAKAKDFYENTLGLKASQEDPGGTTYKTGNTNIFVYASEFAGSNKGTAVCWKVSDIEPIVKELKDKGVQFEQYDNMEGVTREGDIHVMGNMKAAWFKDPAGNILNITQYE